MSEPTCELCRLTLLELRQEPKVYDSTVGFLLWGGG